MKNPLVSVIIPTYNRAWTLENAITSVLDQDYPHIEPVIVDDGSEDGTRQLLDKYRDRAVILHQPNRGVSAARNAGIRKAKGELIALLDSDDAWEKGKVSCQVAFFKTHPDAMICQTEEIWIRNGRRVNPKVKHKKPSGSIFEASLHLCLVSPSAVMMRRELFDRFGYFREDFPVCEDYDLWLRLSAALPVYLIDKPCTVKQGGHEDQLSRSHSQDRYRILSLKTLIEAGSLTDTQTSQAKAVLKKKCRIYGNGCIKRGKTDEGQYYLKLADTV
jgi:glycosyltransferase involved in cell wall biosynthesis